MNSRTLKIVSGGQTGVDRAALDAAIQSGLPHGGWVPLGRTAESERIPSIYVLQETPTTELCLRTEWNIRDSDATLILTNGAMGEGTKLTWELANLLGKPVLKIDMASTTPEDALHRASAWLHGNETQILNIAGPRASEGDTIYSKAYSLLVSLFSSMEGRQLEKNEPNEHEILRVRYEQALENFRHWDQIRWGVPAWFATLFAGLVVYSETLSHPLLKCSLCGMILFSAICILLMCNLIRYHNIEIDNCRALIERSALSTFHRDVLLINLPFELRGRRLLKTATFSLMCIIGIITIALCWWLVRIQR